MEAKLSESRVIPTTAGQAGRVGADRAVVQFTVGDPSTSTGAIADEGAVAECSPNSATPIAVAGVVGYHAISQQYCAIAVNCPSGLFLCVAIPKRAGVSCRAVGERESDHRRSIRK